MLTTWLLFSQITLAAPPPNPTSARVIKVYDGDTFTLENGDKVRLRWVNTPERRPLEPFADEARLFAERQILDSVVDLKLAEKPRDSYGRLVAGVSTAAGDLSVNLVEAGLAHVFIIPPDDTDIAPLLEAQMRARTARRGIWSGPMYESPIHISSFHANASGDDTQNLNGEYLRLCNTTTEPLSLEGWSIRNERGESFPFPSVTIPAGYTLKVHSGTGLDAIDPRWQLSVHLRSERPIWSNEHDRAEIIAPNGRRMTYREHGKR